MKKNLRKWKSHNVLEWIISFCIFIYYVIHLHNGRQLLSLLLHIQIKWENYSILFWKNRYDETICIIIQLHVRLKTTHNEKRITNFGVLYCKLNSWIIWKRCQWKQFCGCNTNNQCNNLNSQKLNDYMMFVFEIYYLELCWITLWWIICIDFLTTSWQDW